MGNTPEKGVDGMEEKKKIRREDIPYLEEKRLSEWVHKKTIQKAIESYRITPEQKVYLRSLK